MPLKAEDIWGWLLRDQEFDQQVELISHDTCGQESELTITLTPGTEITTDGSVRGDDGSNGSAVGEIATDSSSGTLQYRAKFRRGELEFELGAWIAEEKLVFQHYHEQLFPGSFLLGPGHSGDEKDAERFSRLQDVGRESLAVDALKPFDDRVKRVVLSSDAGIPSLKVDLGQGPLMPVAYTGRGIQRFLSIALTVADVPGGLVLVDEIENGIHHAVFPTAWQTIAKIARKNDTQLVATTHSWRCVQAAHQVFAESDNYDFKYLRLDREGDETKAVAFDQESLATCVDMNLEVR